MISELNKTPNGATFYRADLHVHTRASYDFENKSITPENMVERFETLNLDIIALTDHNTVGELEEISHLANERGITVFPGVEITVPGGKRGIHINALFKENTPKEVIFDFLSSVGITSDKRGLEEAITDERRTISDIFEQIKRFDGIVIAAHTDSEKGLTGGIRGQQRYPIVLDENLDAVEITDIVTKIHFDGTHPDCVRIIPCIQSSDAHSIDEIGSRVTRLKMDKPSFDGFKQALIDQESRIKFEDEQYSPYPYIKGIKIEGGFLDGQIFALNKNLNCLIGGRGVGKSSFIEFVRYGLDATPDIPYFQERQEKMIQNLLGAGKISLLIDTGEQKHYLVERKYGEAPKVFSDGVEIDIKITSFFPVAAYSETEIDRVANQFTSQLSLLDIFVDGVEEYKQRENAILSQLEENVKDISKLKREIGDSNEKIAELPTIEEKLRVLTNYNFDEKLKVHNLRIEENSIIDKLRHAYEHVSETQLRLDYKEVLQHLKDEIPNIEDINEYPNKRIVERAIKQLDRIYNKVVNDSESLNNYIQRQKQIFDNLSEKLTSSHQRQFAGFKKLLDELESEGEEEAAKKYVELKEKQASLKALESNVTLLNIRMEQLLLDRDKLVIQLSESRRDLFNLRKKILDPLSDVLGNDINVDAIKGGNKEHYYKLLDNLLTGSYLTKYDKQKIVNTYTPNELYDTIINEKHEKIHADTDLSEEKSVKVVDFLKVKEEFILIQSVLMPDLPVITLKVGDEYKPVSELSLGQKCTTLLSILMLQSKIPLIIDTPEQGLDNIFIYDNVVKTLRAIKEKRQIIIATHDANIPVSGDSEQILCLESDNKQGWIKCTGSIDDQKMNETVQRVLEGGKEAFEFRLKKYKY